MELNRSLLCLLLISDVFYTICKNAIGQPCASVKFHVAKRVQHHPALSNLYWSTLLNEVAKRHRRGCLHRRKERNNESSNVESDVWWKFIRLSTVSIIMHQLLTKNVGPNNVAR